MNALLLNNNEYQHILRYKQQQLAKSERQFKTRQKSHHKNAKLRAFYDLCDHEHHPVIYSVPFKCAFSFYLYAYLKFNAHPFEFEKGFFEWSLSKPVTITFGKIARVAGVSINTVKAAYRELVSLGFLKHADLLTDSAHNAPKSAMVVNDHYIIGYDDLSHKVLFDINYNSHVGKKPISLA